MTLMASEWWQIALLPLVLFCTTGKMATAKFKMLGLLQNGCARHSGKFSVVN